MVFWIADDRDATADLSNNIALGNGLRRVVRALCMYIGTDRPDQFLDRRLVKDRYQIHGAKRGDQLGSLPPRHKGTAFSLKSACLSIGVDPDDEHIAKLFGSREIPDVTDVQEVKTPVREDNSLTGVSLGGNGGNKLGSIKDGCSSRHLL